MRLPPAEVNRFVCKLKLIEHGLIKAVEEVDNIRLGSALKPDSSLDADGQSEESEVDDTETLVQRRNEFVKRAVKDNGGHKARAENASEKIESISEVRRAVIKDFLANVSDLK